MDMVETEGVSLDGLKTLVPENYSEIGRRRSSFSRSSPLRGLRIWRRMGCCRQRLGAMP